MKPINVTNGNEKVEAMRRRFAAYKAKLDQAVVRDQKAKAKLLKREFSAVGEALCKYAAHSPEFHATLKSMLGAAVASIDEATKRFLSGRGWGL